MTKVEIKKRFSNYNILELEEVYESLVSSLLLNADFRIWAEEEESEIEGLIRANTKGKLFYPEKRAKYSKIVSQFSDYMEGMIEKKELLERIEDILQDELLFEAVCIGYPYDNENLSNMVKAFGCKERYEKLLKDEAFVNRREYRLLIKNYIDAAVNLYGVVHSSELFEIVRNYEKFEKKNYRSFGPYKNTICYNPATLSFFIFNIMLQADEDIVKTIDGFIAHKVYLEDFEEEMYDFQKLASEKGMVNEQMLQEFFSDSDEREYRHLYSMAGKYDRYLPENKEEFLKYADDSYEENEAVRALKDYLSDNFSHELLLYLDEDEEYNDVGDVINELVSKLWTITTYFIDDDFDSDYDEFVAEVRETLEFFYITFKSDNEFKSFLPYLLDFVYSVRLWIYNGHSAAEVGEEVFKREEESIEVPIYPVKNGKVAPITTASIAIFPTAPCPCGSGLTYKDCCGKKKG